MFVLPSLFFLAIVPTLSQSRSVDEAMRLLAAGNRAEARRVLSQITASEPNNFEAHYRLGLIALDAGDAAAALQNLHKASQLQPSSARVWLGLAQAYQKSDEKRLASDAANQAERLAGKDPVVLHGLALFFAQTGDWIKAGLAESQYAVRARSDRQAIVRAVTYYLQGGAPKEAIQLAQQGLALEDRADLRNILGKAYEADGQFDKTIIALQEAIRLDPSVESYYLDLAFALIVHQNFDVAIQVLDAARKSFTQSAQLELLLGVAYYGQRRFSDAVESFLRTATLAPKVQQPYVFLARIIEHAGKRLNTVVQKFAAFADAEPDNYLGPFLYAKGLVAQMNASGSSEFIARAKSLLEKAIALNPDFWESYFELALLLERQKDFAKAAAYLEKSIKLDPSNSVAHYRLSRIYDRLDKHEQAQTERMLHQKLAAQEAEAIQKHAAGLKRLELIVR